MSQRIFPTAAFGAALVVFSSFSCSLQVTAADFSRDIQPLLAKRCFACHGPDTQEAGLRFDTAASATAELDSGYQANLPDMTNASLGRLSRSLSFFQGSPPDFQWNPSKRKKSPKGGNCSSIPAVIPLGERTISQTQTP